MSSLPIPPAFSSSQKIRDLGYCTLYTTQWLKPAINPQTPVQFQDIPLLNDYHIDDDCWQKLYSALVHQQPTTCAIELENILFEIAKTTTSDYRTLSKQQFEELSHMMIHTIKRTASSKGHDLSPEQLDILDQGIKALSWCKVKGVVSTVNDVPPNKLTVSIAEQKVIFSSVLSKQYKNVIRHLEGLFDLFLENLQLKGEAISLYALHDQVAEYMRISLIGENSFYQQQIDLCPHYSMYDRFAKEKLSEMIECLCQYKKGLVSFEHAKSRSGNKFLQQLPSEHVWKLFSDSYKKPYYPFLLDVGSNDSEAHEPGYMGAMIKTFSEFLPEKGHTAPLSSAWLISLHRTTLYGVEIDGANFRKVIGGLEVCVPLFSDQNMTEVGLQELKDKTRQRDGVLHTGYIHVNGDDDLNKYEWAGNENFQVLFADDMDDADNDFDGRGYFGLRLARYDVTPQEAIKQLDRLIYTYNREKDKASTPDERLTAIVRLSQNLEQSHLFFDGNTRLSSMLVLNLLLLQEGFPPTLWKRSHVLDAYSLSECCAILKEGQANFLELTQLDSEDD